ncbi:MAG: hypothetical protein COA94_08410 [Rickettsiales bacterium]|nr:MAG: hypothetical protein COA94_08410 [Rickettsiales bacterium]
MTIRKTKNTILIKNETIGSNEIAELASLLQENPNLTTLMINESQMDAATIASFAELFKENNTLTTLNLNSNIGDNGAAILAEALSNNHTLTTLTFSSAGIGSAGIDHLANGLQNNYFLTNLIFWGKQGHPEVQPITAIIDRNKAFLKNFAKMLASDADATTNNQITWSHDLINYLKLCDHSKLSEYLIKLRVCDSNSDASNLINNYHTQIAEFQHEHANEVSDMLEECLALHAFPTDLTPHVFSFLPDVDSGIESILGATND